MSVTASLSPASRKSFAIEVLSKTEPISHLAAQHQVSRKVLYQQRSQADEALSEVFSDAKKVQLEDIYLRDCAIV